MYAEHGQIQIAVTVDIDRCGGSSVVVVVQSENVGALDERLERPVGVVEEAIPLVAAEGSPEVRRLVGHDVTERLPFLDGAGVGDNLSPEERSKIGRLGIDEARVAIGNEELLVPVVIDVAEDTPPCPPAIVHSERVGLVRDPPDPLGQA